MDFSYPVLLYNSSGAAGTDIAQWLPELPLLPNWKQSQTCVVSTTEGNAIAGMYAIFNGCWHLVMPYSAVCASIINGGQLRLYVAPTADQTFDQGTLLFRNGMPWQSLTMTAGASLIWIVEIPPSTGGGSSGVSSVNGMTGAVTLTYSDIPGTPQYVHIPPFTATADGAQSITLPSMPTTGLQLQINGLYVDQSAYSISGTTLQIPSTLNVLTGDVVTFSYEV